MTAFSRPGSGASASRFASRWAVRRNHTEGPTKKDRIWENFFLSPLDCLFWQHLALLELFGHPTEPRQGTTTPEAVCNGCMITKLKMVIRLHFPLEYSIIRPRSTLPRGLRYRGLRLFLGLPGILSLMTGQSSRTTLREPVP